MSKYVPQNIEDKWVKKWEKDKTYSPKGEVRKENKEYILGMFPYPSGEGLHVGHVRIYTGTDVLARYHRMKEKHVIFPMGWDAFGLPAENAAVKAKKNPMDMVPKHIANFKRQMKMMGFSYDWDREVSTIDPSYYKWTQWLFIQFFKMGLLYKHEMPIYYCAHCKTGLAEEEVTEKGLHERCGKPITRKVLPQWLFKITKYADRLLSDLKGLDWPKGILEMQKNWIGRKKGINIDYSVDKSNEKITCFTTRPDTNFGATFIVVAPEHDFVKKILNKKLDCNKETYKKVKSYYDRSLSKTDLERISEGKVKTGVFTGYYAINNLNNKLIPVWISDFVLSSFGTGAVVGVPGHDKRDFEFAKEFGIEIKRVVVGKDNDKSKITQKEQVNEEEGIMINSDFLNGMDISGAIEKMMDYMEKKGLGKRVVTYHIRDWIFSRQKYWGEPIPIIYCKSCAEKGISYWNTKKGKEFIKKHKGICNSYKETAKNMAGFFPLSKRDLPLELPYVKNYMPTQSGKSPLSKLSSFVNTTCPNCGGQAERETDTMPNWAGSCWYFLRFADPKNTKEPFSKESLKKMLPVDMYLGGAEHAVLHLLYSRFWVKVMKDLNLLHFSEPFSGLRNIGMVLASDHKKMSKSLGNIINPDGIVEEYGADALRIYEMFMAPFSQENAWSIRTLQGGYRFLTRVWRIYRIYENKKEEKHIETKEEKELISKLRKTIEKVEKDILKIKYNTSIAFLMEFLNDWEKNLKDFTLSKYHAKQFLQILAPFAPFITEEIWKNIFSEKTSIHVSFWPKSNGKKQYEENINIPVQVNGKVRVVLTVPADEISEESIVRRALEESKIRKYIEGKSYKAIYIKGRILNFVV